MKSITRSITRSKTINNFSKARKEMKLSEMDAQVLITVGEHTTIGTQSIANETGMTKDAVTRKISELRSSGYLFKGNDGNCSLSPTGIDITLKLLTLELN